MKLFGTLLLLALLSRQAGAAGALPGLVPPDFAEKSNLPPTAVTKLTNSVQKSNAPAATVAKPPETKPPDTMEFRSGETLRGTLLGIEPGQGLLWRHPAIRETLAVDPSAVRLLRFPTSPLPKAARQNCRVCLANGDKLAGTLVSLDEASLVLNTWYADTLTLPRSSVQTLFITSAQQQTIYEGPVDMEGWTAGDSGMGMARGWVAGRVNIAAAQGNDTAKPPTAWQYKDGGFQSTTPGAIGRHFKLPRVSNIEFDLECQGYPQLLLKFYADELNPNFGGSSFLMQISGTSLYLYVYDQMNGRMLNNAETRTPFTGGQNKVHLSLRTDREKKTIALFADGALLRRWNNIGDLHGDGTGLLFQNQSGSMTRISNIRISDWDELADEAEVPAANGQEDAILLANHDKLAGQIKTIRDGKVGLKASFGEMNLPLERVVRVSFARTVTPSKAPAGTARLSLKDFGRLSFKLDRWKDQRIEGSSPLFGTAKLNPAILRMIEFAVP
jgi:hypothetical protein